METKEYDRKTNKANPVSNKKNIANRQNNPVGKRTPATKPVVDPSDLSQKSSSNVGKGPAGENL
jgi:hypothetical protein